jgi:cell division protease FtsH
MSSSISRDSIATALPGSRSSSDARFGFEPRGVGRPDLRRLLLAAIAAILLAGGGAAWMTLRQPAVAEVSYSAVLREMERGRVAELTVRPGHDIRGSWVAAYGGASFVAAYPVTEVEELVARASASGVEVTLQAAPSPRRAGEVLSLLMQGLLFVGIGTFLFLHFRGNRQKELGAVQAPATDFGDVAGTQGATEELRELVEFLRQPESFAAVGARVPKGVLLVGPPGTGKTLLARALAGEAGVPFFSISGSEVTGFVVGLGAHRLRGLFRKARKRGGVIFIDEIDVLGGTRGRNRSHNEDDRTLNQLLVEMDGFTPTEGVIVVGATNRSEDLDPALKRPGRFDRVVSVALPTTDGREEILRLHATRRKIPLSADVDLARLARLSPGRSGAELEALLNEAAIAAARERSAEVSWSHMEAARDRLLLGKERVGFRAVDAEWRTVAVHEAGHALAGVLCAPEDPLHKVTIQPRGQAMGVAFFSPDDDRHLYRRSYLEGQILKGLGGRAAEELVFGDGAITSGAQHDLVQVNGIARKMICQLGMGVETGLLVHDGEAGSLSADAHARMDREVHALLDRLYRRVREVMAANLPALNALAGALLERETLDGEEAIGLMEAHGLALPATLSRAS